MNISRVFLRHFNTCEERIHDTRTAAHSVLSIPSSERCLSSVFVSARLARVGDRPINEDWGWGCSQRGQPTLRISAMFWKNFGSFHVSRLRAKIGKMRPSPRPVPCSPVSHFGPGVNQRHIKSKLASTPASNTPSEYPKRLRRIRRPVCSAIDTGARNRSGSQHGHKIDMDPANLSTCFRCARCAR